MVRMWNVPPKLMYWSIWCPVGDGVWRGCGHFGRWVFARESRSLRTGPCGLQSCPTSCPISALLTSPSMWAKHPPPQLQATLTTESSLLWWTVSPQWYSPFHHLLPFIQAFCLSKENSKPWWQATTNRQNFKWHEVIILSCWGLVPNTISLFQYGVEHLEALGENLSTCLFYPLGLHRFLGSLPCSPSSKGWALALSASSCSVALWRTSVVISGPTNLLMIIPLF